LLYEDWLLRAIARLGQALAGIASKRDMGLYEEALNEVEATVQSVLGLSTEVVARLQPSAVVELMHDEDRLNVARCIGLGLLLREAAELQGLQGRSDAVQPMLRQALEVLVVGASEREEDDRLLGDVAECAERVPLSELSERGLKGLFRVYDRLGRWDRAEDVLFVWLDRGDLEAVSAGMAFFERLWGIEDALLRQGGLSADEILEGIAELQRRSGKR